MLNNLTFFPKRQIDSVDSFSASAKHLLYRKEGKLILDDVPLTIEGASVLGGYIDQDGILTVTTSERLHFRLLEEGLELLITPHMKGLMNLSITPGIRLHRLNDSRYAAYSISTKVVIKEYALRFDDMYPSAIYEEHLLSYKYPEAVIESYSLLSSDRVWSANLSSYGRISQVLGLWNQQLLLWLNSNQLLCLDAETGQIVWLSPNLNDAYQRNGFYSGIHLVAEEDRVVILYNNSYFEFNLAKQEVSLVKDFGPWGTGWMFATSTMSGQYLYFTGRDYSTGQMGVGAFDRHQLAVVWFYAPAEWQGQVPKDYEGNAVVLNVPPQVTDTHLYVLENGTSTLHVLERDRLHDRLIFNL